MKRNLRNGIILSSFVFTINMNVNAQWCNPTTLIPYNLNMPGITNVTVGNINRTSADLENTTNSLVNTGLTLNVQKGSTYTISITHTIDPQICPDMNLRVWIDYNHDFQLDDPGETVISTDFHLPGSPFTSSFTVPMTAQTGITKMRVTAKMSINGGHILPTPCDNPADPIGYHGEMEDYNVNIGTTGIDDLPQGVSFFNVLQNPSSDLSIEYALERPASVAFELFDALGKEFFKTNAGIQTAGNHQLNAGKLNTGNLPAGIYCIRMNVNESTAVKKIVVL